MFGIGKLIGGALNAVGLGKIAPFVSLAVNAFTGNWAGVAMDVAGLAARIAPNSGFAKALSTVAPIASAFIGGGSAAGGIGSLFKSGGFSNLISNFNNVKSSFDAIGQGKDFFEKGEKILNAFKTANSFVNDLKSFNLRSADAHRQLGFGNVLGGE